MRSYNDYLPLTMSVIIPLPHHYYDQASNPPPVASYNLQLHHFQEVLKLTDVRWPESIFYYTHIKNHRP